MRDGRGLRPLLVVLLLVLIAAPAARAADPYPGTLWTEHYFESGDGTRLHADVLRPAHLPPGQETPVILTVSPYTNHSGSTSYAGKRGPSDRFYDFLSLTGVIEAGYTYVMVDLRGFGGSGGCNDWGGPGERMDAKAAVEWAASQPWSTGSVGVIGKSYDGWTGLMAMAERPKGLAAVVSMEPVYSGYRYLYMDGVRFINSLATPASFTMIDATPGNPSGDSAEYLLNGTGANGGCYAANIARQQQDDPGVAFWRERDLIPALQGITTPLLLTQGFLETNTKPDGLVAAWSGIDGPKRAWFGQFDHVRGWEMQGDEPATGRAGFAAEVRRFLDRHVRGIAGAEDPAVVVQAADGRYRAEAEWPPADVVRRAAPVATGSYSDDGSNSGTGARGGNGLWSISDPLPHPAHLAGEPQAELSVQAAPRANLVVNLYDIAPDGRATMISRGAMLLREGKQVARPEMYGQDWPVAAGHRIGVLVSGANAEWFEHVPTNSEVIVTGGSVRLPFLSLARTAALDGGPSPRLRAYLEAAPFTVAAATIAASRATFELPPALRPAAAPVPAGTRPGAMHVLGDPRRLRLRVRAVRRKGVVIVSGSAPPGTRLRVSVRRGGRRVATRRVVVRRATGGFRTRLRAPRRGRLTVRVTAGRRRASAPVRG